jgi:hypothetical protein
MFIELLLTLAVAALLGFIVICEWVSAPDPKTPRPTGRWASLQRADTLLAGCFVLCLVIIWLPLLFGWVSGK